MSKKLYLITITISITIMALINPSSCKGGSRLDDIEDVVKELSKKVGEMIDYVNNAKNETNNTEIIAQVRTDSIEQMSSSAQVSKLQGIKDSMLPAFLDRFLNRMKLPSDHFDEVATELYDISTAYSKDWQTYKFLYSNSESNSTNYVSIFAQHDPEKQKSSWMYTEISSKFTLQDVLVITKIEVVDGKQTESVDVVTKPSTYDNKDLDILMKFYEATSIKAFGKYLGISESDFKVQKDQLFFLQ